MESIYNRVHLKRRLSVAKEHLSWSVEDFTRMRELDPSLYVNAVFNLGHEAFDRGREDPASFLAVESVKRALVVSESSDWLELKKVVRKGEDSRVNLADACGLCLVDFLPEMSSSIVGELKRHFHGSGKDGGLCLVDPDGWTEIFNKATNPFDVLASYAAWSKSSANQISEFLTPIARGIEHNNVKLCVDLNSGVLKETYPTGGMRNISPLMHAVFAENIQAIESFTRIFPSNRAEIILKLATMSDGYSRWAFGKDSACALEIASKGRNRDVMSLLLSHLKESADPDVFSDWVGYCLINQTKCSGLLKDARQRSRYHDDRLPVFEAIMDGGAADMLAGYEQFVHTWAAGLQAHKNGKLTNDNYIHAGDMAKRCEEFASEAINAAHPQAIHAAQDILSRTRHIISRNELKDPLLKMNLVNEEINFERIFEALEPEFLRALIEKSGETLLIDAARNGKARLAMALVERGVDPEVKDERNWKAASHFKGEAKSQWAAYLSSRKAIASIDDLLAKVARRENTKKI